MKTTDRLLNIKEVGELLRISRYLVYDYIRLKQLVAVNLPNGHMRIKMSDLQSFIRDLGKVEPTSVDWDGLDKITKEIEEKYGEG